jgi:hypothetical protein
MSSHEEELMFARPNGATAEKPKAVHGTPRTGHLRVGPRIGHSAAAKPDGLPRHEMLA